MQAEETISLSKSRFTHAAECLTSAETLVKSGDCRGAANRSYYAIFHAMRSVLALDGFDSKKHSGIIAEFRKNYIKTGIFTDELSDTISELFQTRTDCDYDDFYLVSKSEVAAQLIFAKNFIEAIERYLKERYTRGNPQ